jgi:hypothetical protein
MVTQFGANQESTLLDASVPLVDLRYYAAIFDKGAIRRRLHTG